MRYARIFLVTLPLFMLLACGRFISSNNPGGDFHSDQSRNAPHPWTNLGFKNNPADFHFAIIADRAGGPRAEVFEDAIRKVNLLAPEFVINVGDLIAGYTPVRETLIAQQNEVDAALGRLEMPFFYVPGNHDILYKPLQSTIWKERYGRTYYHFVYKDVLFLSLDVCDSPVKDEYRISDAQIDYFRSVLKKNRNVRWTCVFLHMPFWLEKETQEKNGWAKMEELLNDRPHTVFAGHGHTYTMYNRNGHRYYRLAITGGGSQLRGKNYGEFDEIVWVTMTDKGPRVANLDLTGIYDENVCTDKSLKLLDACELSTSSIRAENGLFRGGATSLTLTNPTDLPAQVQIRLKANRALLVTPAEIKTTIPAHTSQNQVVRLSSVAPLNPALLDPVSIEGTVQQNLRISGTADSVVKYKIKSEIVILDFFTSPK